MKAYLLTVKGNGRLIDGKLPFYPSILPKYDIVYALTAKDNIPIPAWYSRSTRFKWDARTWYCWQSKLKLFKEHNNNYPDDDLLFLEDDVRFLHGFDICYTSFMSKVPDDWGVIWFGGKHLSTPKEVVPGVLECGKMCNSECILIRSNTLPDIISVLESEHSSDGLYWSDQVISSLRSKFQQYAPLRQFAWQQTNIRSSITLHVTTSAGVFKFKYTDINNNEHISTEKELLAYT